MVDKQRGDTVVVHVTNISPHATESNLRDFFNFCGTVTSIKMSPSQLKDDSLEALVEFEGKGCADTALLLTHAIIKDRPIKVQLYSEPLLEKEPVLPAEHKEPSSLSSTPPSKQAPDALDPARIIVITNVSASVNDDLFLQFFGFCGAIVRYSRNKENCLALVEFSNPSALVVAQALGGGRLGDKLVTIQQLTEIEAEVVENLQKDFIIPPPKPSTTNPGPSVPLLCRLHREYVPVPHREKKDEPVQPIVDEASQPGHESGSQPKINEPLQPTVAVTAVQSTSQPIVIAPTVEASVPHSPQPSINNAQPNNEPNLTSLNLESQNV